MQGVQNRHGNSEIPLINHESTKEQPTLVNLNREDEFLHKAKVEEEGDQSRMYKFGKFTASWLSLFF